tara:strand:+ start:1892 stop:2311 length:420 start_codon:yes stop_codon:yes gene_type:complete
MGNYFCRVFYEDTDSAGIVYYANYLKFIERARTETLREIGVIQSKIRKKYNLIFVVKNIFAEFIKPAKLDDLLEIKTNFIKLGMVSVEIEHEIFIKNDIIFKAKVKLGLVDINGKIKKLPQDLQGKLEKLTNSSVKIPN